MVQIVPPKKNLGSQLGEAIGSGFARGSEIGLSRYFDQLQQQQHSDLQNQQRMTSATNLADQLFGKEPSEQKSSLISTLSAMDPKDQIRGIGQLAEAEILNQYLRQASPQMAAAQEPAEQKGLSFPQQQIPAIGKLAPLAHQQMEQEKMRQRKASEIAGKHFEIAKPTLLSIAEKAEALPQKEAALQGMMHAIESKNLGFFTRDNLAEITGLQGFLSPEGAVFKTTGKEFFLGSLKRAGARPNQWIEQQISDMLPKIGRSTEANLSVAEALKTEIDVEKKQIELTNAIADRMEKEQGYIGRDLSSQVQKQLSPYANQKQDELKEKLQAIKDNYEPMSKEGKLMYDPEGNLRRVPPKDIKAARKANYRDYK